MKKGVHFMSGIHYLKQFDKTQLWRLFIDGRFHKKYNGWVGYEAGERGSIQALLNGFSFMLDHFDLSNGLKATYLRELHKVCMLSVETTNLKSSPGDIRYLNSGMPFFAKTTTYEHLQEIFALRKGDGTALFNTKKFAKTADELDIDEVFMYMKKEGKINYRNWYPNLDIRQKEALEGKRTLTEFYEAKHSVQMLMVSKMEEIIHRYNSNIQKAKSDEEKIKVISLVSRELELLHPFPDGNSRTFSCIMGNHLLMYNGFAPMCLENPNLDNEVSHAQWIEEVNKAMQRTKELIENPKKTLFNYSIAQMSKADKDKFLTMAQDVIKKIDNYKEIYLTPNKLVQYTKGTWIAGVDENLRFTGVGTYGTYGNGNIYFAMAIKDWVKENKDPKAELETVLKRREIRAVVLDDIEYAKYTGDLPVLLVEDCFKAFKNTSIQVRQDVDPFTILVTGTEGKTGSKVQFHHILNKQVKTHAVLNSANTEIPVLRSLINLAEDDKVEVNEVSVGSNEAYRVERTMMVNPNLCFFTNIGPNHMDMHKTLENIMIAKSSVVEGLREGGKCILNAAIEHYDMLLKAINDRKKDVSILTYGYDVNNTAYLISQRFNNEKFGWDVEASIDAEKVEYFLPLFQNHAPLNSVGILLTVKEMGYDVQKAAKDYEGFVPFETMGRILKIHKKSGDVYFYDQSRRGGIHGMRSAFNDMKNFNVKGKIVALVGGISTKKDSDWTKQSHKMLAEIINESQIDRLYTTGNFMDYVIEDLKRPEIFVKHSEDLDVLAQSLYDEIQAGDLLFIIGNAYLYLGRVSERILKLKDTSKYDYDIDKYDLSDENRNLYKGLIVLDEVEHEKSLSVALAHYHLEKESYKKIKKKYGTFTDLRAAILMHFFQSVDNVILKNHTFVNVNEDIKITGKESYVYNETYCKEWFNNYDKIESLPRKQLFGSFYFFGDMTYLLHIEVATMNLHIGFVKYTMKDDLYKVQKMDESDCKKIASLYSGITDSTRIFEYRTWGLRWYSLDYGRSIDLTKASTFKLMNEMEKSLFKTEVLDVVLEKIVSS